jgi:2-haloacid dehalogenase
VLVSPERWITFDCYGTLIDWLSGFRQILRPVAGDRVDDLVAAYHSAEPAVEREFPGASYRTILNRSLQRAAAASQVPISVGDLDVLADHWAELPLFPDTEGALAALRSDGWRLGILTNCDTDLFESTRNAFPVQIDMVVTAEEVGNYKPDLAHFTEFERRSGIQRANWVHAAVSWSHDMAPARTLGLRRVWVDREQSGHDPSTVTARVINLTELVTATHTWTDMS